MNSDQKLLTETYKTILESSSQHAINHIVELEVSFSPEYDETYFDLDVLLDGKRISNTMVDKIEDFKRDLDHDLFTDLGERLGRSFVTNLIAPLEDNVEAILKDVLASKVNIRRVVSKVVINGSYNITRSPVSNF